MCSIPYVKDFRKLTQLKNGLHRYCDKPNSFTSYNTGCAIARQNLWLHPSFMSNIILNIIPVIYMSWLTIYLVCLAKKCPEVEALQLQLNRPAPQQVLWRVPMTQLKGRIVCNLNHYLVANFLYIEIP